jgi:hypothetical protein
MSARPRTTPTYSGFTAAAAATVAHATFQNSTSPAIVPVAVHLVAAITFRIRNLKKSKAIAMTACSVSSSISSILWKRRSRSNRENLVFAIYSRTQK